MYKKRNTSAYAVAIYDLVKKQDKFKLIQPQFEAVKDLIDTIPGFIEYLGNDLIPEAERFKTIDMAFDKNQFDYIVINSIKVIVQRKMVSQLKNIIIEYLKLSNDALRIRYVLVESAFPLSDEQLQQINDKLQKVTRRTIEIHNVINPNIISGFRIVSKTEVIEMNILHDLNKIKNEIIFKQKEKEV
ncbi:MULTISPECIES: ATP synthase F1 subunit delta [unclassified Mycoplasma]|uniref:ATP synthase F1 subunit delta n=1 Tax=unclassified Mycoplasma TaxID=2683645 RepID=UPI002B1DC3D1|nr:MULTISPECIES: ATP synthase F1 subunit delta [unclassified Mycoplasma]MEA4162482.1 ATP synthase F1 subunit delta [Mycoplasma sp. 4404]MEA4206069.1 ATP synthase F1 subunit delta [Mycoplasma sp. 1199]